MTVPVTCILPTYNRAEFLGEAIESILSQTARPERILVVDDGSTDATASVVASYATGVDYLFKQNGGKSSALNVGLRTTQSPYVWIFDDDDIADQDALTRMYGALAADDRLGFVFGPYRIFEKDGGRTKIFGPETLYFPMVDDARLLVAQLRHSFVHQPGLLVRKRCYDAVGPFDETMLRSQDYEMMLRLSRAFAGKALADPLFSQRRHKGARGTAVLRIGRRDVQRVWTHFDRQIIRRASETLRLAEFLSKDHLDRELSPRDEILARLERAALMAGRGLWDAAIDDLQAVVTIAAAHGIVDLREQDRAALKRFFGRFSSGLDDLPPYAGRLSAVLAEGRGSAVVQELRIYLAWGLPYRLAASLAKGRFRRALLACRALAAMCALQLPLLLILKGRTLLERSRHVDFAGRPSGHTADRCRPAEHQMPADRFGHRKDAQPTATSHYEGR